MDKQSQNLVRKPLLCLESLRGRIDFHGFQTDTASRVIHELGSRAILADEVGLGKTVEAGLVLKELVLQGLVANALVLVPKSLEYQWQIELVDKFEESFYRIVDISPIVTQDRTHPLKLIAGHALMSRDDSFRIINSRRWDIVIVDEAHRFGRETSKMSQNLALLEKDRILLLTATPLQNSVSELFRLVRLAKPEMSQMETDWTYYAMDKDGRTVRGSRLGELHELMQGVMCRTTRSQTGLTFPPRVVTNMSLTPSEAEASLIQDTTKMFFHLGRMGYGRSRSDMARIAVLQSLSSHPEALSESISGLITVDGDARELIQTMRNRIATMGRSSKEDALLGYLQDHKEEQAVIFVERLATGRALTKAITSRHSTCAFYQGSLSSEQRRNLIRAFREGSTQYLISTSAGCEGLNLQNAHILVNYDLHWNPLKLEQRIGRVHRFGQNQTVEVVNLTTKGTIDDWVLTVLWNKIDLFNSAIGEIDSILAECDDEFDIERSIQDVVLGGQDENDIVRRLSGLGKELESKIQSFSSERDYSKSVLDYRDV